MDKSNIWCRLAQNAIKMKKFHDAESFIRSAEELSDYMNPAEKALFTRVVSNFLIETGRQDEAQCWIKQSYKIGLQSRMAHHIKHIQNIISENRLIDVSYRDSASIPCSDTLLFKIVELSDFIVLKNGHSKSAKSAENAGI
ncbi:MAG: hypothetical protein GY749_19815 [Desulfobacteraceae bacterium]|nr:hypothetical protein [Desulfobacteraceae bacterium]